MKLPKNSFTEKKKMSIFVTGLFIFVPFLTIPIVLLGIILDKKHSAIYAFLLALAIGLIAYNFKPNELQDLYRHYYLMENQYSQMNFAESIGAILKSNKFIFVFILMIITQIGNYQLLPLIIVTTGYFIVFYTILDYAKLKQISFYKTILILLSFLGIFYFINFFSGLAQFLGIAIGFLAFYLEYIKEKKGIRYKILYLIPAFIHSSLVIIIMLRIILHFNFKKIKKYFYSVLIIITIFPTILLTMTEVFKNNFLLGPLLSKTSLYLIDNFKTWEISYGKYTMLLVAFYILVYILTSKRIRQNLNEKFCDLIYILSIGLIPFVQYFDIFVRFSNILILLMNIYLLQVLTNKKMTINNISIIIGIIVLAILGGIINYNVWLVNDFNNVFNNIGMNVFYLLQR